MGSAKRGPEQRVAFTKRDGTDTNGEPMTDPRRDVAEQGLEAALRDAFMAGRNSMDMGGEWWKLDRDAAFQRWLAEQVTEESPGPLALLRFAKGHQPLRQPTCAMSHRVPPRICTACKQPHDGDGLQCDTCRTSPRRAWGCGWRWWLLDW